MFLEDMEALDTNSDGSDTQLRIVADIVASLSDRQAVLMYARLTGHAIGSVADIL
jgi:dGTP triphosphohydrolase